MPTMMHYNLLYIVLRVLFILELSAALAFSSTATTRSTPTFAQSVTDWLDSEHISWRFIGRNDTDLPIPAQEMIVSRTQHPLLKVSSDENTSGNKHEDHSTNSKKIVVWLHLLPSPRESKDCVPAAWTTRDMTNAAMNLGISLIHLHQDVWLAKTNIVRSRLLVRVGRTKTHQRIFARKTKVQRITASEALPFLQEHHLWSATKAKYYYGLFLPKDDTLVAVATFSSRRKIMRNGVPHRSHELIRFCPQRDGTVVGGITKLIKAFVRDHNPDDIVTVVDRDWGPGNGWHGIGFETVHIMPPLPMVMGREDGVRRHLVGAGIQPASNVSIANLNQTNGRLGLEEHVLEELHAFRNYQDSLQCLEKHGFYPVFDAGVERLFMVVPKSKDDDNSANGERDITEEHLSAKKLWENSSPQYACEYYSDNSGIATLLRHARMPESNGETQNFRPYN